MRLFMYAHSTDPRYGSPTKGEHRRGHQLSHEVGLVLLYLRFHPSVTWAKDGSNGFWL